ncbi:hypothetical protein ACWCQM_33845 [Streptomyces sp. NPDC002125]
MPHYDERPRGIEDRLGHDRPGTPERGAPRGSRRGLVRLWLTVGIVALVAGIVIGHGLLIAAGLVVAGMAGQLFDPQRARPRGRVPRPR